MATATRPRIVCEHQSPACYVSLVDARGVTVVGPLWITNLDVVELRQAELQEGPNAGPHSLGFIHADACHTSGRPHEQRAAAVIHPPSPRPASPPRALTHP